MELDFVFRRMAYTSILTVLYYPVPQEESGDDPRIFSDEESSDIEVTSSSLDFFFKSKRGAPVWTQRQARSKHGLIPPA